VSTDSERINDLTRTNADLRRLLEAARDQLAELREKLAQAQQPPQSFGTFVAAAGDHADVIVGSRKMRVAVMPEPPLHLTPGDGVLLNAMSVVVGVASSERTGQAAIVREVLDDERILVVARGEDERVARLVGGDALARLGEGDTVVLDAVSGFAFEKVDRSGVEELLLEEVPDVDYESIGGLAEQIERIRDAIELPMRHPELYREHALRAPRGLLLYGPPGCGKTLIAKAVAHSLADAVGTDRSYFLSVKGPELLNKYVGETERYIRTIFERARSKAAEGTPVVIFFDEMDALFRARGSGVSSDMENTIVPQLLTELDGVEGLSNVLVIGASNREDMIDPAILRPGRLDVKIAISRPTPEGARDIFHKYLVESLPLSEAEVEENGGDRAATVEAMITDAVARIFAHPAVSQVVSGALIRGVVDRAKTRAVKQVIAGGERGIATKHLLAACDDEIAEALAVTRAGLEG